MIDVSDGVSWIFPSFLLCLKNEMKGSVEPMQCCGKEEESRLQQLISSIGFEGANAAAL